MPTVRLAVIFYSTYGTNHQMAEIAADAARTAGAEVRLLKVKETAPPEVVKGQDAWRAQAERTSHIPAPTDADMEWANAYLFSAPTRYGVSASQLRAFIDTLGPIWAQGKLANKAVTAMSSAQNTHGGQESTILGLYTTMMHWGAIIVPPGYTDPIFYKTGGNPYGMSVNAGNITEDQKEGIRVQAKRLVQFAAKLAG
ncbi:MAG TPA: NAD(P)H:quinone oxidoreductase [Gemmatimonadaceae bacterium]|jgi:NAD(P)H dehydrogenase (quinone)|nr:NAD(P)H:quinone oxidoreductase [Gemmatimonadaceae bacterium]